MKQETTNKFAAILAAAQSKAGEQTKQNFSTPATVPPPVTPEPEHKAEPAKLVKMESFTILWHEGTGQYDGKTFTTWEMANKAMTAIYKSHEGAGYTKVKICVKWADGSEITDRADCSDSPGDFCAKRETIGEYLSRQNSVMYASNLQVGDRAKLSFKDEYFNTDELRAATVEEFLQSTNFINDAAQDSPEELSTLTIDDILGNTQEPQPPQNGFEIVDYSDKAFAIPTATKPPENVLNIFRQHGTYNPRLKCGKGWIFSKKHLTAIKEKLGL